MTQYTTKTQTVFQQGPIRVAKFPFTAQDAINNPAFFNAMQLPPGAIDLGLGYLVVSVAFDSTTATVSVGTAASAASLLAATTLKTVGKTALTAAGISTTAQTFGPTFALTGTTTVGAGVVYIPYILPYDMTSSVGNNLSPNL